MRATLAAFPALAVGLLLSLALGGCSIAPTHPALADAPLAPLVPVRDFVASRQATGNYQVSPDGRLLAWQGTASNAAAILVRPVDGGTETAYAVRARGFFWSADSRYLVASVDSTGDENAHLHSVAVANPDAAFVDRTPQPGTLVSLLRVVDGGATLIVSSNMRDRRLFEPYRLDLDSGRMERIADNPGDVRSWTFDRHGSLRTRTRLQEATSHLEVADSAAPGGWRRIVSWGRDDSLALRLLDFSNDGRAAWALSNRDRDKTALVRLDLADGGEQVIHAVDEVDLDGVRLSRRERTPQVAYSMPGYPRTDFFDDGLRARLAPLSHPGEPSQLSVISSSSDETVLTVAVTTDRGTRNWLVPASGAPRLLGESRLSLIAGVLSDTRPIAFNSRDGLRLHGYLTLPARPGGAGPRKPLPMVLLVHGGPWARDRWGGDYVNRSMQQFLANRGYAVLQINYRGSSGYGRAFMDKAIGEFAGRMHDDLIDGVQWAVREGIADPQRVAIYGASYGGYAALVGATFTPEAFACAVDVVGMSDLARLLEQAPPYWELSLPWWKRFVGDPADPVQRRTMEAKSPLYRVNEVQRPMLVMHGVNDPRVKFDQSQRMVDALRAAGKPVTFVTFEGDGHGNQKWTNNLTMYREAEDFLARCLGGRSSGFDGYQLVAWMF